MNFDPDTESSQWHAWDSDADLVKWQGSQSNSAALNALMQEAARPARRCKFHRILLKLMLWHSISLTFATQAPRNHRTQQLWTTPIPGPSLSASSTSPSSSSSSAPRSKPRVPRSRARHPTMQHTSTSFLTSTPASALCSDPMQFLQTLKGVSEKVRVDEGMRVKKHLISREVKATGSIYTPTRSGKEKENLRRSTTGVRGRPKSPIAVSASRSLPIIGSRDADMDMEVDESSMQMDIDVDLNLIAGPSTTRLTRSATASVPLAPAKRDMASFKSKSHMLPPPVPIPKVQSSPRQDPRPTSVPVSTPPQPAPQHKFTNSQLTPPAIAVPTKSESLPPSPPRSQPVPTARPPSLSQLSRPPALGMRRAFTTYTSISPSQTLPEKQRGFKVPLAKPSCPPVSVAAKYRQVSSKQEQVLHTPLSSPPIPLDAVRNDSDGEGPMTGPGTDGRCSSPAQDPDSSYGDMSFDMDALEETMKKYD